MFGRVAPLLRYPVRFGRPLKIRGNDLVSHLAVLITAAGLQGEQPLVDRIM